jgi:hypothetical protein
MAAAIALGIAVFALTGVLDAVRLPALSATQVMLIAFGAGVVVGAPIGFVLLFSAYLATWATDLLPAAAVRAEHDQRREQVHPAGDPALLFAAT